MGNAHQMLALYRCLLECNQLHDFPCIYHRIDSRIGLKRYAAAVPSDIARDRVSRPRVPAEVLILLLITAGDEASASTQSDGVLAQRRSNKLQGKSDPIGLEDLKSPPEDGRATIPTPSTNDESIKGYDCDTSTTESLGHHRSASQRKPKLR